MLLKKGADVLLNCDFGEARVFSHRDSAPVGFTSSQSDVATADFDLLAQHVGPQKLTLVGAELAFGECSQF
jgi:hypothetical protein